MASEGRSGRGCVFFNFGTAYALRLLVSIYSLRKFYDGPITVFLAPDENSDALGQDIHKIGADVALMDQLSSTCDRYRVFTESPFEATLSFDSDIVFRGSIDALWEPLERDGVLVTRFFAPLYGVEGTAASPGFGNRMALLENIQDLVERSTYDRAVQRLADRIDINIGVLGVSRPRGDGFLADWAECMERGRNRAILLLDEMLVVALVGDYPHYLADESWNCPADEYFRRTNLADASIIHYFADAHFLLGHRMGRNPATWAGRIWYACYFEAATAHDLKRWRVLDRSFDWKAEPLLANGPVMAAKNTLRNAERAIRRARKRLLGQN